MQDLLTMLQKLHRPRLLMRAARIGAEDYRRGTHLPRILGFGILPRHGTAIILTGGIRDEYRQGAQASGRH